MTRHLIAPRQLYYLTIVRFHSQQAMHAMKRTIRFAQITNTVIRFAWVMYLPSRGLPFQLRTFLVAMLEMFRRWQWNFRKSHCLSHLIAESDRVNSVRLENEHLGNIDQYRATRDVPLPYAFDLSAHDSDIDDWDQPHPKGWWAVHIFTW